MPNALRILALCLLLTAPAAALALQVGDAAPDFTLTDLHGEEHHLADYCEDGKFVVLEWFNPGCPFVQKHHERLDTMERTFADHAEKGAVVWLAINSGAPGKQGHGLQVNRKAAKDWELGYPVLLDESGEVGRAYGAKTTPHMFIIDAQGKLRYQGAIDDQPSPAGPAGTNYVAAALDALLSGEVVATPSTKPYGCSVKYGK